MATRGSMLNARAVAALLIAISANSRASGSGITAQSANTRTRSGIAIKNALDTTDTSGFVRITCSAGRIVSAVV